MGQDPTSVTVDRRVVSAPASVAFTGPDAGARHGSEEEREEVLKRELGLVSFSFSS